MKKICAAWTMIVILAIAPCALAMGLDGARQIALDHAGVADDMVTFTQQKEEMEDGLAVYDIEFAWNGTRYDYEIDAATGEILAFDLELGGAATGEAVSLERAQEIALLESGFAAEDVQMLKAAEDTEDGRQVYEFEFTREGLRYECEVDAATGLVTEWGIDRD